MVYFISSRCSYFDSLSPILCDQSEVLKTFISTEITNNNLRSLLSIRFGVFV